MGFVRRARGGLLAAVLTEKERLLLQQLRLLEWAEQRARPPTTSAETPPSDEVSPSEQARAIPERWVLTRGIDLRRWQIQARDAWFQAGGRGTVKVVTGAGKTILALAIVERLQQEHPDLRVAIVVPTIVLMNQWYDTIREHSDLPDHAIARLGGGHAGAFSGEVRILIAVLASARKELPRLVQRAGIGKHLLLIADECHRVGAPEMSAVLNTERAYTLGLSATPERDDSPEGDGGAGSGTGAEDATQWSMGPIVYELTFEGAFEEGILPRFEIHHFGLPLSPEEASRYAALSRSIKELRRELMSASPTARKTGGGERLLAWARRVSARGSGDVAGIASRYVHDTTQRKLLLYRAEARKTAALSLIQQALATRPDTRVILFHESIDEVISLFDTLYRNGVPAVMEHSGLPESLREVSLDHFRTGTAQVVVSARSLIEGFDVPAADLGIIVASSSSTRQRIQSIGRVLRPYRDPGGDAKTSRVCVLYIRDTVDEAIYEKEDWDRLLGLERNRYFLWDPPAAPIEQPNPPRAALPKEHEIDFAQLEPGSRYPGRYEGTEYSIDTHGNVLDADGRIARNPQGIPERFARICGGTGRFRVTPVLRAVLTRRRGSDGSWETIFCGFLDEPFDFGQPRGSGSEVDVGRLGPGDEYQGPVEPCRTVWFRRRRGGVIAKRIRGGEVYARGPQAERLVRAVTELARSHGAQITKICVNHLDHAFWWEGGKPRFITALEGELEFPEEASGGR